MGLFVNNQDRRSELQERISAELREKAMRTSQGGDQDLPELEDSKYLEGTSQVSGKSWLWTLLAVLAAVVVLVFLAM